MITRSSTPHPDSNIVKAVWDIKKWLEPHLGAMEGHSKYHVFRFTLNASSQKAVMHFKTYSDMAWRPAGDGKEILLVRILFGSMYMYIVCMLMLHNNS